MIPLPKLNQRYRMYWSRRSVPEYWAGNGQLSVHPYAAQLVTPDEAEQIQAEWAPVLGLPPYTLV